MPGIRGIGPKGSHQAAGSCHKGPSGASTRAGLERAKMGKNRRLLLAGSFKCGQPSGPVRFRVIRGHRPVPPNHDLALACGGTVRVIAARGGEIHYVLWVAADGVAHGPIKAYSADGR